MTEKKQAIELANRVLDRVSADPDDDLAVLARQLIRAAERNKALEEALSAIASIGGNMEDSHFDRAGGANDARMRGGLFVSCREIAREALKGGA